MASVDDDAIYELYAAREMLEGGVAALAARNATAAELAALQQMVAAESAMTDSAEMMFEHNRLFHQFIYRAARNRYLTKHLQSIYDTLAAHRSISTMRIAARRAAVLREHRELCAAIRGGTSCGERGGGGARACGAAGSHAAASRQHARQGGGAGASAQVPPGRFAALTAGAPAPLHRSDA